MECITKYNTDIGNLQSGESFYFVGHKIKIIQRSFDISYPFEYILKIARETESPIIIKTLPYGNKKGKWYVKSFVLEGGDMEYKYEYIKSICEQNERDEKWKRRECYLVRLF